MKDIFLWPSFDPRNSILNSVYFQDIHSIENNLRKKFPSGYPVLCSSGRSAICLALNYLNLKRNDFVGLFPYASHCVLDAVSRVATPISGLDARKEKFRLVYHQWGYVQELNLEELTIEDCVDTLCEPGTTLFPGGGSFEIWSLPKILGISSGGVLWCKNEETAIKIREIRDKKNYPVTFQWGLKLLSNDFPIMLNYWEGIEASNGRLSNFQLGEINSHINKWDYFVRDKKKKFELAKDYLPEWIKTTAGRLPSVIPISKIPDESKLKEWHLTSGIRNFIKIKNNTEEFIRVFPLPIHIDIPMSIVEKILKYLSSIN